MLSHSLTGRAFETTPPGGTTSKREPQIINFETTPPGGTTSKREPQIILKTDERSIHLELGRDGKFAAKSGGWDENRVFLEGDRLVVEIKNGRWLLTHLPAGLPAGRAGAPLLPDRRVTLSQRPATSLCDAVT